MENWAEIRRRVLVDGQSKRSVCREFDIHWDTLKKILDHPGPPGYRRTAPLPRPELEAIPSATHQILLTIGHRHALRFPTSRIKKMIGNVYNARDASSLHA